MKSRSSAPSASTTFRRPSASAASVPGIGARWVSRGLGGPGPDRGRSRRGGRRAWRAIVMLRQRWWLRGQRVAAPQDDELREAQRLRDPSPRGCRRACSRCRTRRRSCRSSSGAARRRGRSTAGAPRRTRPGGAPCCRSRRRARSPPAPNSRMTPANRSAISSSASSQEMRSNSPPPLRTDAPHRIQEPLRRLGVRDVVVELGAQDAAREGVLGIALEPHRAPVLHGHDPAARVRAVHRARSENPGFYRPWPRSLRQIGCSRSLGCHVHGVPSRPSSPSCHGDSITRQVMETRQPRLETVTAWKRTSPTPRCGGARRDTLLAAAMLA